jgi:hypothetical protein
MNFRSNARFLGSWLGYSRLLSKIQYPNVDRASIQTEIIPQPSKYQRTDPGTNLVLRIPEIERAADPVGV